MKTIDDKILGAVKVKQPVSQVSKIGTVLNLMTSPQGQTTWNTDCTDDADATDTINRKEIFGSEHQNPRISAQSAASAFPFRFDGHYFINPNNHAQNPVNSISCCHCCTSIYEIIPQQIRHCLRFAETFPYFKNLVSLIRQLSWTYFIESKNLIKGRCDDE